MIPLTPTQFRSALDCAVEDHSAIWEMSGHCNGLAEAEWYSPIPGVQPTWLRCILTDVGTHYYITNHAPLDVRVAAGLANSAI